MPVVSHLIRRYGRLVLESMGARGLLFVGDAAVGMNVLRRGVGSLLRAAKGVDRRAVAGAIAVTPRTVEKWIQFARESGALEDEDEALRANSVAARVFFAAGMFLQEAGEDYRSLGVIADHVRRTVPDKLTTEEIHKHLDAYVTLSILEHHPEDCEMYRLAAPVQYWSDKTQAYMENLLGILLPAAFELGYEAFVGSRGALARVVYYRIPEERRDDFVRKVMEEMRRVKERLDEYEKELQQQSPGGTTVYMRDVHLAGFTSREPILAGPLDEVRRGDENEP